MRRTSRDWRSTHWSALAEKNGIEVRSHGGSHYIFSHPNVPFHLSVPRADRLSQYTSNNSSELMDTVKELEKMNIKKIKIITPPHAFRAYHPMSSAPFFRRRWRLSYSFPDLPGCISDGETIGEATHNGRTLFLAWMSAASGIWEKKSQGPRTAVPGS